MAQLAKILVVDDEAPIRYFLQETLEREGYWVKAVESGEDALEAAQKENFDLALLDLRLSGMGGMDVLSALHQCSPDTAIIILTGHASLETAVEALRQGAHDYLFKPCKTVELRESIRTGLLKHQRVKRQRDLLTELERNLSVNLEEIRATVSQHSQTAPSSSEPEMEAKRFLQRGAVIVDLTRHIITVEGYLLELSPTEFGLLAYLASESPRVISPQELVREVQGYESAPWEASETARYHIYRIRRKIQEATGREDIVRNVRGVGYVLSE